VKPQATGRSDQEKGGAGAAFSAGFKILISAFLVFSIVSSGFVIHYYNRCVRIIDLKLSRQVFLEHCEDLCGFDKAGDKPFRRLASETPLG
jgi:hypothetical protein